MERKRYRLSKLNVKYYDADKFGMEAAGLLYRVYDNNGLVGHFARYTKSAAFAYGDLAFQIIIKERVLFASDYTIIDDKTKQQVGHYNAPISFWNSNSAQLVYAGKVFKCRWLRPNIRLNLFKRSTWGHYKFEVFNDTKSVIYNFKLDFPQ